MVFFTAIVTKDILKGESVMFKKGQTIFFNKAKESSLLLMGQYKCVVMPVASAIESITPIIDNKSGRFLFNSVANKMAEKMYKKIRRENGRKRRGTTGQGGDAPTSKD